MKKICYIWTKSINKGWIFPIQPVDPFPEQNKISLTFSKWLFNRIIIFRFDQFNNLRINMGHSPSYRKLHFQEFRDHVPRIELAFWYCTQITYGWLKYCVIHDV